MHRRSSQFAEELSNCARRTDLRLAAAVTCRTHCSCYKNQTLDHELERVHVSGAASARVNLPGPDRRLEPVPIASIFQSDTLFVKTEVSEHPSAETRGS